MCGSPSYIFRCLLLQIFLCYIRFIFFFPFSKDDYVDDTESNHKSKPKSELTTAVSNTVDAINKGTIFSDKGTEILQISANSGPGMGVDLISRNTEAFTNLPGENSHLLTVVTNISYSLVVNTGTYKLLF